MGLGVIKATFLLQLLYCGLCHFLSKKKSEGEDCKGVSVAQGPLVPTRADPLIHSLLSLILCLSLLLPVKMAPDPTGPIEEGFLQIYSS